MITIGIDPHKSSLTAVAVDATGQQLAARRFTVNAGTFGQLTKWTDRWPQRRFAVEGANGLGRGIAQQLAAAGETVLDVPATLAARARLLDTGGGRKTDAADAVSVAHVALRHRRLRQVTAEDQSSILRLLAERRDDLAHERTRILNRLHGLLRDLIPGGAPVGLSADKAAVLLRTTRPQTATAACRRDLARDLLADLRRVDRQLKANEVAQRDAVAATGSTLSEVHGIAVVLSAKILGHVGDVTRFPTADHFASYTGTSPLDASSGNRNRHRLNTGGNRQLNSALHTIAVCQARDPGPGRVYYLRKISEGKTPAEARRALKRRLANVIYRHIQKDQKRRFAMTT
ncbi:IS110 family transposase [Micromonospora sp. RTP1Z1]|uniref:IS110 family transposase n=1 Tax=Micromonospora sp. RTP1Z1 TaxID=2994043 RepID=UPI0029C9733E|nr:IS110 family transposase [Micromonospora sp. RTP1Z1]